MANVSNIGEDPFADLDLENKSSSGMSTISSVELYFAVFFTLANFIITMAASFGSLFLIYIIYRFENLRTRSNIFIMHYAIVIFFYNIFTPMIQIVNTLAEIFSWSMFLECAIYQVEHVFLFLSFTFSAILAIDWWLDFKSNWMPRYFNIIFRRLTILAYCLGGIYFVSNFCSCFFTKRFRRSYSLIIAHAIYLGITSYVYYRRTRITLTEEQIKSVYSLYISILVFLAWFPSSFLHCLFAFAPDLNINFPFFVYMILESAFESFAYTSPIFVIYLLGRMSKDFKMTYDRIFKKSVRNYGSLDQEADGADDASPQSTIVKENGTAGTFSKVELNLDNK